MNDSASFSDEAMVERVRSTDQELYAIIVDRYQGRLRRYATSLMRDEHQAADVVQEAFIKAFVNLQSFDVRKKFSSWIYRIVHNEAMNHLKKYQKEMPFPEDIDVSSTENIEQDFVRQETVEKVGDCLGRMPMLYAEPLALHYIEEKSYEEISDILRVPMGTVATRLSRGRGIMKQLCQKN